MFLPTDSSRSTTAIKKRELSLCYYLSKEKYSLKPKKCFLGSTAGILRSNISILPTTRILFVVPFWSKINTIILRLAEDISYLNKKDNSKRILVVVERKTMSVLYTRAIHIMYFSKALSQD